MASQPGDLSSEHLLERLRRARTDLGLSQEEVAEQLGMARTTLIAIEGGQRPLRPEELVQLAELYGERIENLLRAEPAPRPLAAQFRTQASRLPEEEELRAASLELQRLAEDYVALEQLLEAPLPVRYPPARALPEGRLDREAELIAEEERLRLGLGNGPLPHLREILETEVGLRVFSVPLPSRIAGLFAFDDELGACVAINSGHRWERQRWSLAHEYAHFLTRRDKPEITVSLIHYRRVPAGERFADHFARHLLMPGRGLERKWHSLGESGTVPTVATLLTQADWWGVSVQAFALTMEQRRLIRPGTYDALQAQGLAVDEARSSLALPEHKPDDQIIGRRMRALAVSAYAGGLVSEERLAELLRVDPEAARHLAGQLPSLDSDSAER
jgi:Zn-dependent peptidase ImmA (M78 family)/DNA-binding XRE family transcriptional regulator